MKILIAYASRYGATREIAERMADVLKSKGAQVDLRAAEEVTRVESYNAVIIGSAVYSAGWLPEAYELLESFQEDLKDKALWLFSDGLLSTQESLESGTWTHPASLQSLIETVQPEDVALFAGKLDADKLKLEDWLLNRSVRGVVGDYRNWSAIEAWASGISQTLSAAQSDLSHAL